MRRPVEAIPEGEAFPVVAPGGWLTLLMGVPPNPQANPGMPRPYTLGCSPKRDPRGR
jgi:hypothetical protein